MDKALRSFENTQRFRGSFTRAIYSTDASHKMYPTWRKILSSWDDCMEARRKAINEAAIYG